MKVLGLDISTTVTGYSVISDDFKLIKYGQFSIKDRTLSDTLYGILIADNCLALAEKHKVDYIIIEDIFFSKDPTIFRRWARVQGAVSYKWYKKSKKEPIFMMAISARPKVGINGKASKIEVQLEMAKRYKLITNSQYTTYKKSFDELLEKKKYEELPKNKFDYQVKKLSIEFEKNSGISEHIGDSLVLSEAFYKGLKK